MYDSTLVLPPVDMRIKLFSEQIEHFFHTAFNQHMGLSNHNIKPIVNQGVYTGKVGLDNINEFINEIYKLMCELFMINPNLIDFDPILKGLTKLYKEMINFEYE